MNITVTKIKRELQKKQGWYNLDAEEHKDFVEELIKDTIDLIDNELIRLKNISIKKK